MDHQPKGLRLAHDSPTPDDLSLKPVRVLDIELSRPLSGIPARDERTGKSYGTASALIRLHSLPLGVLDLPLGDDGLTARDCADHIWRAFGDAINDHLLGDGIAPLTSLPVSGLSTSDSPPCLADRRRALAEPPTISVVVCTRDRTESLAKCLPSLLALDYARYEVIVVDNAPSTTGTAELLADEYESELSLCYLREERPGLSWARNCGLRHAKGEIVAFVDDDARPDRYWLAEIARGFARGPRVACVTGLALPAELETPAQLFFEQFGGLTKYRGFRSQCFDSGANHPHDPFFPYLSARFGAGVNMAFRTSVLLDLGAFDPSLGAGTPACGAEDIEAFFRVIDAGYTLAYEPGALVRHYHRRDYASLRRQLHGMGTAFTAYLSRCLADRPARALDLLREIPKIPGYLLSPRSPRNASKPPDYPRELSRTELLGMLKGPIAYAKSRRRTRQIIAQYGRPERPSI